jgi:hypothetical protein
VFAATAYHTVVVAFDAVVAVVAIVFGDALDGTPAKVFEPLIAWLLAGDEGQFVENPPIEGTQYPQVFTDCVVGLL